MYDELAKRLRDYSAARKGEIAELTGQAADAIEELSRLNAEITRRELKLRMSKPSWIPVTERLPKEADGMVFVLMPDVFPYNSKQPFVNCNQDRRIDMAHYSEHSKTWYFGDCGAVGGQEPIAWIHRSVLPQPPKEET